MTRILPTIVGIGLLSFSAGLIASDLAPCVDIDDAAQRLACYDRQSGRSAGTESEQVASKTRSMESVSPEAPAATAKRLDTTLGSVEAPADPAGFGLKQAQRTTAEPDHITATIVSVQASPSGAQVISLSNGQVWTEIEKGKRPIEPSQEVTIWRYRWHYEMKLRSQPDITVKRLQ